MLFRSGGCGTPASAEDRQAGRGKLRSIREKQRFKTHHAGAAAETAAIPCVNSGKELTSI